MRGHCIFPAMPRPTLAGEAASCLAVAIARHAPTAIAVGLYALAFVACARAAFRPGTPKRAGYFWLIIACVMFLLAVCKALGLPELVTELGRDLARSEGWYVRRRPLQVVGIGALVTVCVLAGLIGARAVRRVGRRGLPAMIAAFVLLVYVSVQAISLHQLDRALALTHLGRGIEAAAILVVGLGAWRYRGEVS